MIDTQKDRDIPKMKCAEKEKENCKAKYKEGRKE